MEFIPQQKLVMRTSEGPFSVETNFIWTVVDNQTTKMTLQNESNPTGFSKMFARFMTFKKANNKDLKNVKWILENK